MMTFKLLLWLIPIAINVYVDRKGRVPFYLLVNIARGIAAILHGTLMLTGVDYTPWTMAWWELILLWLPIFTFQMTSFWLLFDLGINIVQKKSSLLYRDTKEGNSGWIERFFKDKPDWTYYTAKAAALVLLIISSYVLVHNYQ